MIVALSQWYISKNVKLTGSVVAMQADVSAALTAHIGSSTPVQISFSPAPADKGVAFLVSVQFPPNNQLSSTVR